MATVMTFEDQFTEALAALKAHPSETSMARVKEEPQVLASGRTLEESLDLLASLIEAITKIWNAHRLSDVPISIKQTLLDLVRHVNERNLQYENRQIDGTELDKAIDQLHSSLWQSTLLLRIDAIPGIDTKTDQLQRLVRKGRDVVRELETALTQRDIAGQAAVDANTAVSSAQQLLEKISQRTEEAKSIAEQAQKQLDSAGMAANELTRIEQEAKETFQRVQESENKAGALRENITVFFDQVDKNREQMEQMRADADTFQQSITQRTDAIIRHNEELQIAVEGQLQKATGASLFSSFHERQKRISWAKLAWGIASIFSLLFTVGWSIFLARTAASLDTVFFVRLAGTVPVLVLVAFSLQQYGRERHAEEEYAFKAALSLALVPYKELIEGLESKGLDGEYAKFLTGTIGQIFEPPRQAKDDNKSEATPLKMIDVLMDVISKLTSRS